MSACRKPLKEVAAQYGIGCIHNGRKTPLVALDGNVNVVLNLENYCLPHERKVYGNNCGLQDDNTTAIG